LVVMRHAAIPQSPDTPSGYRGWLYGVNVVIIHCATIPQPLRGRVWWWCAMLQYLNPPIRLPAIGAGSTG